MTLELPAEVEADLRDLASEQGRSIQMLVEEAVREYLVAAATTDLKPAEIAEAQLAMVAEFGVSGAGSGGCP